MRATSTSSTSERAFTVSDNGRGIPVDEHPQVPGKHHKQQQDHSAD
ncbi:MAG: hypothetical protein EAS49_04155 [Brucella intermedia]|nr:MAG: hypothetical protein EAS49_04155 [Brucella intermedia]